MTCDSKLQTEIDHSDTEYDEETTYDVTIVILHIQEIGSAYGH